MQLVFITFQKDLPWLCLFISERNQKQRDYFMPVSPVLPNPSELLSVFSSLVMAVRSKYRLGVHTSIQFSKTPSERFSTSFRSENRPMLRSFSKLYQSAVRIKKLKI